MEKIGRNSLDFYFVTIPLAVRVYIRNLPQKTGKIQFLGKSFAFFARKRFLFLFIYGIMERKITDFLF